MRQTILRLLQNHFLMSAKKIFSVKTYLIGFLVNDWCFWSAELFKWFQNINNFLLFIDMSSSLAVIALQLHNDLCM